MRDKRKVGQSSAMAIASSAQERHGGRKGQDVLWIGSDRWRRAFASECYGAALGRGQEDAVVDSAVFAASTGALGRERSCKRVWESETLRWRVFKMAIGGGAVLGTVGGSRWAKVQVLRAGRMVVSK